MSQLAMPQPFLELICTILQVHPNPETFTSSIKTFTCILNPVFSVGPSTPEKDNKAGEGPQTQVLCVTEGVGVD